METIEAGKLSDLAHKFGSWLDKLFDKIGQLGERDGKEFSMAFLNRAFMDADNAKDIENNIKSAGNDASKWPNDYTLVVKVEVVDSGKDYETLNIYVKKKGDDDSEGFAKRGIVVEYSNPSDSKKCDEDLADAIVKALEPFEKKLFGDYYGYYDWQPIESSIQIKLQKIVASDTTDIHLLSVNTPYDVDTTNDIITRVVDNPDFVDELPDLGPVAYNIFPEEDDSFGVEECEECCVDMSQCIFDILNPVYRLFYDCMYFRWNASGMNYPAIVSLADTYNWMAMEVINRLSEYHYSLFNYAPHPVTFATDPSCMETNNAIICLQGDLTNLVNAIDLFYCNFDGDIQSYLLNTKSTFEHELNYTLARFDA